MYTNMKHPLWWCCSATGLHLGMSIILQGRNDGGPTLILWMLQMEASDVYGLLGLYEIYVCAEHDSANIRGHKIACPGLSR